MENWLSVVVGIYLLAMVLYGHHRGLIRLAVSMLALIVSLSAVHFLLPAATEFVKENTAVQETISENMKKWAGLVSNGGYSDENLKLPAVQRSIIENSDLPQSIKDTLIENNNSEVYEMLGVQAFTEYIGKYLANKILNSIVFILLFLAIYILIRIIMKWLDIIARLPVLSGINKLAGAVLGGAEGLVFLWIAFLAITALSYTSWGTLMMRQIETSKWLSYLYGHNFLNIVALSVFQGLL